MALVRCERHGKPKGRTQTYVQSVKPLSWPKAAVVCGLLGCKRAGLIWLNESVSRTYGSGQRVFGFNNASMKGRAV